VTRRLGTFRDELAAVEAYDEAARELFPDGVDAGLAAEARSAVTDGGTIPTAPDARPGSRGVSGELSRPHPKLFAPLPGAG
jgi:hypothetical protein